MRRLLFLFLAFAAPALAQRTVVTLTVADAQGIAYNGASLTVTLSLPVGTSGAILNGVQVNGTVGPVQLDANGAALLNLPDNTVLQCANTIGQIVACAPQTQWTFAITASPGVVPPLGTGPQTCSSTLTISGASQTVALTSCPSLTRLVTGTVGGGPGGGGGGTPPTQAGGNCLAPAVLPGQVCAGPPLTPNGAAATFEVAYANTSSAALTSYTVTGAPLAGPSLAMLLVDNSAGGAVNAPDGTWTLFDDVHTTLTWTIYQKVVSTNASVTAAGTMSSGFFNAFLGYFGGSITSTPHTATSNTVTCAPSDNCASLTIGPVSASNVLLLVGHFAGNANVTTAQTATVTDSTGNGWQKLYATNIPSPNGQSVAVWFVQNPAAGSPVITVDGHTSLSIIGGCCKVYEIAGPTGYYTGSTGPPGFRYLNSADLFNAGIPTGIYKYFTQNLGADIAGIANNSTTTLLTQAVTFPTSGCPCRALVNYGAAVSSGNSHLFETWISDGSTTDGVTSQEYVNTGLIYGATASPIFPTTGVYGNGQVVTFTLNLGITTLAAGSVTAKQLSPGGRQATWMKIAILPTQN